ncbi:MAG TPA: winged helix-turn-helix domain-containing protein [Bacteroidales bacterium]|nr:winged helix-turn-helix domain-containing protein [Bacteroidales bacterium]HSA42284.1 winged helix-turn-helix domain-containing protein [Bacteroidales bacterium]
MPKPSFTEQQKQIAGIAKALSHPARVYILQKLHSMNACCTSGEMIGDIPIARSTLSQHLKELKYAGLIQGEIEPPMIKYCINKENWEITRKIINEFFKPAQQNTGDCKP